MTFPSFLILLNLAGAVLLVAPWVVAWCRKRPKPLSVRLCAKYSLTTEDMHTSGHMSFGFIQTWEGILPIPEGLEPLEARDWALRTLAERFDEPKRLNLRIEKETAENHS